MFLFNGLPQSAMFAESVQAGDKTGSQFQNADEIRGSFVIIFESSYHAQR